MKWRIDQKWGARQMPSMANAVTETVQTQSSLEFWLDGAKEGSPDAFYNLGLLFSTGNGVEIDLVQAHKWFNLAALRGNEDARNCRAQLAQDMNAAEIAEAQRQAREWLDRR